MRIITGSARGTKLETLDGRDTRPTVARVKEALFSMIQFDIEGRRVLDLFGGSGQLALEALSRGAASATILDDNRAAAEMIRRNAQKTRLYDRCVLLNGDYQSFLKNAAGRERFDIIFLDPPYAGDLLDRALAMIVEGGILSDIGYIICESDRSEPPCAEGLCVCKHARYGKTFVTLLRGEEEEQ